MKISKEIKQQQQVVDQILAVTRETVLDILESGANLEYALDSAQGNGEAAYRIWRAGYPAHWRLKDGCRDMVLALACLQLGIQTKYEPEKNQTEPETAA
jgi:hypothetical protein